MNALDKAIATVSPARGLNRLRARLALSYLESQRNYDAAAMGRRTDGWGGVGSTSAGTEVSRSLNVVRLRYRDLVRNNPWAARAKQAVVSNAVGRGIGGELLGPKRLADEWKTWSESTACDFDGCHNLGGLQALGLGSTVEGGDALVIRRPQKSGNGIPLKVQVLEGDYLDHTKTMKLPGGNVVLNGVEFNQAGGVANYWLFGEHPGDVLSTSMVSKPEDARNVSLMFRKDRPGQFRGMPWGASVMITLRDLDDYEDALLFRQKLANCFLAFATNGTASGVADAVPLPEVMEPGMVASLPGGGDVKFSSPPKVDGHDQVMRMYLHRIAAGFGITYAALTGILSDVNYSSGKMGDIQMDQNIGQWRHHLMIPQFCNVVGGWFLEAANLAGFRTDTARFTWTPPRKVMLEPKKETDAALAAIGGGLMSLQDHHRQYGLKTEDVLDDIEVLNKEVDKRGIFITTDARLKFIPNESSADDEEDDDE